MTNYYVSEAGQSWQPTRAKTVASAKRAARLIQRYQGTRLDVGERGAGGGIVTVARLIVDAINFNDKGYWYDL